MPSWPDLKSGKRLTLFVCEPATCSVHVHQDCLYPSAACPPSSVRPLLPAPASAGIGVAQARAEAAAAGERIRTEAPCITCLHCCAPAYTLCVLVLRCGHNHGRLGMELRCWVDASCVLVSMLTTSTWCTTAAPRAMAPKPRQRWSAAGADVALTLFRYTLAPTQPAPNHLQLRL